MSDIFKAYDVRGEWNKDWNSKVVYKIGKALAFYFKPKTVGIGRDIRNSSEEIFSALSLAFLEEGIAVKDLGLCGTELTYFASSFRPEIDLAVMITASHNPPQDNGLKITPKNSLPLGLGFGLEKIRDLVLSDLPEKGNKEKGAISPLNLWPEYREHIFRLAKTEPAALPKKKVVVDAGNGMGGYVFDQVLKGLNLEVIKLFWQPEGNFPNHPPNPLQEKNLGELKRKVLEEKADLGIAYDGDSDRIFLVDEKGGYLPGYYCVALMTEYLLKQSPCPKKEVVVCDPRYYWAIRDIIEKYKARGVLGKVGHTLIKAKMREAGSFFSGEWSGHLFYRENNYAESSMLTTLLVLKLISQQPLSSLVKPFFERYPISGEINFTVGEVSRVLKGLEENYVGGKISKLDGLSIDFPDWRFNVRSSNTQALLRLNAEAKNKDLLSLKIEELKGLIGGKVVD